MEILHKKCSFPLSFVTKPLNVSKTVCSNKTGLNVCKVSSVSQLVKSSTVSKFILSNNARNVNSINQLVKTFNVTNPVSNFVTLFLILLVIVSQLKLLVNLLMRIENVLMIDLLIIRTVANMISQNHLVPRIF